MLKGLVIGNLGADAQVVRSSSGEFVSMNVAHSRKFTRQDGTPVTDLCWVNVVINWNASKLLPFLLKGCKVFVSGNLRTREYVGHDGKTHCGVDVIADTVELCGSRQPDTQLSAVPETETDKASGGKAF